MADTAYLILENGAVFEGESFGASGDITGEIVFTTGMTGYLETLTDQSYHGQIILQTFPLIGNYGIIPDDFESSGIGARGYIVKHPCGHPSNFRSTGTLDNFLKQMNIIGLCKIDTRALAKIIRENGVMNGKISRGKPTTEILQEIRSYKISNAVNAVSIAEKKMFKADTPKYTVALIDFGYKDNIRRELNARGCDVWLLPGSSSVQDVLDTVPDGIMLSNGPGDPAENIGIIGNLREILKTGIPIFGICLGHQLLALAHGFKTHKMKYGHRGLNQPVKDLLSDRVYITSQNHGYAVMPDSIDTDVASEWFVNVNDKTCEGIMYKKSSASSVQFHPEACGGPEDTTFLFDRFIRKMEDHAYAHR